MERAPLQQEGTIGRARSARCQVAYDLHICPVGSPYGWWAKPGWFFCIAACNMAPRSRGTLRLASPDPTVAPIMDHGYLTDEDDHDLEVLLDGVEIVRSLAAQPPLAGLLGRETGPSLDLDRQALRAAVRANCVHYYHPVGTCRMGPASDPLAVVDNRGRMHGLEGVRVADASIMPVVPRANTNLPTIVVGEKLAAALLEDIGQLTAAAAVGTKRP